MKKIGYKRVSSKQQKFIRQDASLDKLDLDKIYVEKLSGKSRKRPELEAMMSYIRAGDKVFVHSTDRIARNARDLLNLVDEFRKKQVIITFIKDRLTFNETDAEDAMQKMQFTMLAAFSEFERNIILSRQREAIDAILEYEKDFKKKDKTFKGKPPLKAEIVEEIRRMQKEGATIAQTAVKLKRSRTTIVKYRVKNEKNEKL